MGAEEVGKIRISDFGGLDTINSPWTMDPRDTPDCLNVFVEGGKIKKRPGLMRRYNTQLPLNGTIGVDEGNLGKQYSQLAFVWQTSQTGAYTGIYAQNFNALALGDVDGVGIWTKTAGGAGNTIENQTGFAIEGRSLRPLLTTGVETVYSGALGSNIRDQQVSWDTKIPTGLDSSWYQSFISAAGGDDPSANLIWGVKQEFASSTTFSVKVTDASNTDLIVATLNTATNYKFSVTVVASGQWEFSIDGVLTYTGSTKFVQTSSVVQHVGTPTSESQDNTSGSLQWSHTVPAGDNRILLVSVAENLRMSGRAISFGINGASENTATKTEIYDFNFSTVSGVQYGGVAMTYLGEMQGAITETAGYVRAGFHQRNNPRQIISLWGLKAPATGTANVTVSFDQLSQFITVAGAADSYAGVDQVQPLSPPPNYQGSYRLIPAPVGFSSGHLYGSFLNAFAWTKGSISPFGYARYTDSWGEVLMRFSAGSNIYPSNWAWDGFHSGAMTLDSRGLIYAAANGGGNHAMSELTESGVLTETPSSIGLNVTNRAFETQTGQAGTTHDDIVLRTGDKRPGTNPPDYYADWIGWEHGADGGALGNDADKDAVIIVVSLQPHRDTTATSPMDRILLVAQTTSGPDNLGVWDNILVNAAFTDEDATKIFVVQGGLDGGAPRLLRGEALDQNTAWTVVGDIAANVDTSVNVIPFRNSMIFPPFPAGTPKQLTAAGAIQNLGGTPPDMAECMGFNRMLFGARNAGLAAFSAIDNEASWLSSDTLQLGQELWTASSMWDLGTFGLVITESALYGIRGYGRTTNRVDRLNAAVGAGDIHAIAGTEKEAFFIGHSVGRRVTNVPGQNPYHAIFSVNKQGSVDEISRKIRKSSLFATSLSPIGPPGPGHIWYGRRNEVSISYDSTNEFLYVLAPKHQPYTAKGALRSGNSLWVRGDNGGWWEWSMGNVKLSYVYPFGTALNPGAPSEQSGEILAGGEGTDGLRYVYFFDRNSPADADNTGVATDTFASYWTSPKLRIFEEDRSDIERWFYLFGEQGSGDGMVVEYRLDSDIGWTRAGGTTETYELLPEGRRVSIGKKCRLFQYRFAFATNAVGAEMAGCVIGFDPIGHHP